METVETVVVGAGVVGLAVARELALSGREVLVLEAAEAIGTGMSSRNSEVIHAGIYYPAGSRKARLCVAGRRLLYDYCRTHKVPFSNCGKLIVAVSDAELGTLRTLLEKAKTNGVDDLVLLEADAVARLEPELAAVAALLSPSTGIVDSHALMLALLGDAQSLGAMLALGCPVERVAVAGRSFVLEVSGADPMTLAACALVNASGLGAQDLARATAGLDGRHVPPLHLAKGNYFTLSGRSPFSRLIYPVPVVGGLGVHVTLDLAGRCRFGPDVEWVEAIGFDVDPGRADSFEAAVRRYWPALPGGALHPDTSGIRPKLTPAGDADFMIEGPREHGIEGLVNLFGIESPGLTASLAIASLVAGMLASAGRTRG